MCTSIHNVLLLQAVIELLLECALQIPSGAAARQNTHEMRTLSYITTPLHNNTKKERD